MILAILMHEHRDRLLDVLLREELGGDQPPDLTRRVLDRAFGGPSWRRWLAAGVAAAVLVVAAGWLWWQFRPPSYPTPVVTGSIEVVGGGPVERGAVLTTRQAAAAVELGGYCRVELQPATTIRLRGQERAEEIHLEAGEVRCRVERAGGSFTVRTAAGSVAVTGTEFSVSTFEKKGEQDMIQRGMFVRVLVGMVLVSGAWGEVALGAGQERSFLADDKKEPDQKSGTVVGELTSKGENFIEVKADGEEKARRYVPNWVGGAPAQGGGPDKEMVKIIKDLKVGSRLRVEWKFEERPRVVKVEVLKKPDGKPEDPKKEPAKDEPKSGKAIGALVTKGDRFIELKADGEEKPRRYLLHMGGTKELLAAIKDAQLNSRIEIEWIFLEHLRVVKLTVLKAPDK